MVRRYYEQYKEENGTVINWKWNKEELIDINHLLKGKKKKFYRGRTLGHNLDSQEYQISAFF